MTYISKLKTIVNKILPMFLVAGATCATLHANNFSSSNRYFAETQGPSYVIQVSPQKQQQIQKALLMKQYVHDLNNLSEIINLLINNRSFVDASENAEQNLNLQNDNNMYTVDFLKNLEKVLKGVNPYDDRKFENSGYNKEMEDLYKQNYENYIKGVYGGENLLKSSLNFNLDYIKNNIKNNLKKLQQGLNNDTNIRPYLENIYRNLIIALENVKNETLQLKNEGIIKNFNAYVDSEYHMPKNWAQIDGNTNLADIINFILNGDKKAKIRGIEDYYNFLFGQNLNNLKKDVRNEGSKRPIIILR